jgi:hypothetical protein
MDDWASNACDKKMNMQLRMILIVSVSNVLAVLVQDIGGPRKYLLATKIAIYFEIET